MKVILIAIVIIAAVGVAGGLAYSQQQSQLTSLRGDNDELQRAVLSLEDEAADLGRRLDSYQDIAAYQEELARSLRLELNGSIGNRLVITEAAYEVLPKTMAEARAQGYSLLDTVNSEGELIEAACFAHEGSRHYGQRVPRITDGVEWHGAPLLLMYDVNSEKLIGTVLESTSPQLAPPWEYHANGHPGMDFAHWSLHLWFIDPPKNLSLEHHEHS